MINNIHYPVALNRLTNKLVNAFDIERGVEYDCFCIFCNEDLETVNKEKNIPRPYFRHKPNSNCKSNYETYIHWLAKEVFRDLKEIKIPAFTTNDVNITHSWIDNEIDALFKKHGVRNEYRDYFRGKSLIEENKTIKIDSYKIEKEYITDYGSIRVDIVVKSGENTLLIEPYYSCQVTELKSSKLEKNDLTTMAINLNPFQYSNNIITTEILATQLVENVNIKGVGLY